MTLDAADETDTPAPVSFGGVLRRFRLDRGLTQEALAERAGLSPRGIQALESGTSRPQRETARRLTQALGLNDEQRAWLAALATPAPRRRGPAPPPAGASTSPLATGGRAAPLGERAAPGGRPAGEPAGGARTQGNLPAPLSSFVGRRQEIAAVQALLARSRLVTLTGPGGTGKTRLALEVARKAAADGGYADGVWFVDLTPVREAALVPRALAHVLGMAEQGSRELRATLADALRERHLLLVIDNCEHVLMATPLFTELLAAAPRLTVLATSRAVLHLVGEHDYLVPPLTLLGPPASGTAPAGAVPTTPVAGETAQSEAVQLFVERARAAAPNFTLTADVAPDVAELCQALDGLPLAIELAAARMRLLPPAALLAQVRQRRLDVLDSGPRDAPARHHTLRAALAASVELLAPSERRLLYALAVFAGGCTLEAAEAVCPAGTAPAVPGRVLDGLGVLVDHSLVRVRIFADGAPHFDMLETIRELAHERLAASGELAAAQRRHAAFFLTLAEQAATALHGPQQVAWLDRLEHEHDNLRAALRWALDAGTLEAVEWGLRLCVALEWFWWPRRYFDEPRTWLTHLLAAAPDLPQRGLRARAMSLLSRLEGYRGSHERAWELADAALELARACGDRRATATALYQRGWLRHNKSAAVLRAWLEESIALFQEAGEPYEVGLVLDEAGIQLRRAYPDLARRWLEESVALARTRGDIRGIASPLWKLGHMALRERNLAAAGTALQESLALYRQIDARNGIEITLGLLHEVARQRGDYAAALAYGDQQLAELARLGAPDAPRAAAGVLQFQACNACQLGDYPRARQLYAESLRQFLRLELLDAVPAQLAGLGELALRQGQIERAARLAGAAAGCVATREPPPSPVLAEYQRAMDVLGAGLADEPQAPAWQAAGRALSFEEAIAYALEPAEPPAAALPGSGRA